MSDKVMGFKELSIRMAILEETRKFLRENKISERSKTGVLTTELADRIVNRLLDDPKFEVRGQLPNDR